MANLRLGGVRENMADMVQRGRSTRGERCPYAKLSNAAIERIRHARDIPQKVLASEFSISQSLISMIQNGQRWRHIQ